MRTSVITSYSIHYTKLYDLDESGGAELVRLGFRHFLEGARLLGMALVEVV